MQVGIAVSVIVEGATVDPADVVGRLSSGGGIRTERVGNVVWLLAEERSTLGLAAEPLTAWWREQGSGAVLRLDGEVGVSNLSYLAVDDIDCVRELLQVMSGTLVDLANDSADLRHSLERAGPRRRKSASFTARLVGVADDDGILSVGVAEHRDGTGHTLVLQGVDPASRSSELLEPDEGYCVIVDREATVYGGLAAIGLRDGRLQIRFTPAAARTLDLPTEVTITLDANSTAVSDLRTAIRRVIAYGTGAQAPPTMDLE